MKNTKKIVLLFFLAMLMTVTSLFVVACGGKNAKLSFEVNGGEQISAVEIAKDTAYGLPTPNRGEGYSFSGWYLTEDFSGSPVTEVTLSEDATVYAKWEKLYAVNLTLNGGSLSKSKIYLKQGANVSEALSSYVPEKSGMQFGAWFIGNAELGKNLKMPAEDLTLEAKYKAPYTVETYLQNTSLNGYDKQTSEVKYEYVGKTVSLSGSVNGFRKVSKGESVESLVMTEGANVLKAYYDRNAVSVTFYANYPDGTLSEGIRIDTYYGVETIVPDTCMFEYDGYYLEGFSTSQRGEIVYKTDFLKRSLYGSDETVEPLTVTPERTTALYGVWKQGYKDMFGGDDAIFIEKNEKNPDKAPGVAYLKRGSYYFKGVYYPTQKYNVVFEIDDENTLRAVAYDDQKNFVYLNDERQDYSSKLFVSGVGLDAKTEIKFDSANGVSYYVDGNEKGKGTYQIENNLFMITFTEGEMAGETMCVNIGQMSDGTPAFQIRNEEEVALGKIVRFGVNGNSLAVFTTYQIEMDGFGTAKFYTDPTDETKFSSYTYVAKDGLYTLYNSNNQAQGSLKIFENNGKTGYMFYSEALDRKIESSDGAYLETNGLYALTYYDGTTLYTGAYTYTTSVFGGYILSTSLNGNQVKFLVKYHTEEVIEGEGDDKKTVQVVTYEFAKKLAGYAEYYYTDNGSIYYAPLIVIDDETAGYASVYGYTASKTYEKVLTGKYTEQEDGVIVETNSYKIALYSLTDIVAVDPMPEVSTALFDYSTIESLVFALDPKASTDYNISYWFNVTFNDGTQPKTMDTTMNGDDGDTLQLIGSLTHTVKSGTLTVSGMAIYTSGGSVVIGPFTQTFTASASSATTEEIEAEFAACTAVSMTMTVGSSALYFEIDNVNGTYLRLSHAPMNFYRYKVDGSADQNEYIYLNGKGRAEYTVVTVEEVDGKEVKSTEVVVGKVTETGKSSKFGSLVYTFTPDEEGENGFAFIQLYTSQYAFFSKYEYSDTDYQGKEYVGEAGLLVLDGFGYAATYTDRDGNVVNGRYLLSGSVVTLTTSAGYEYFDVKDDGSFTMKGDEYPGSEQGGYIIFDNQRIIGRYVYFDGYGVAKIFEYDSTGNDRVYVDENAVYTVENGLITVKFNDNGVASEYVGKTSTFTYSQSVYATFVINKGDSVVKAYIENSDWTVLILDDVGKAVRYKDLGAKETGTYKLITETLLYYLNDSNTDACLYNFDPATGKLKLCESLSYSYYTEDLNTLIFTKYGFVVKNGVNSFYYTTDANKNVTVYKYDDTAENKNAYGFVTIDFGKFNETVTFEESVYYIDNKGYKVTFVRTEESASKYPYDGKNITNVKFTPVGGDTYTVEADITLGENEVSGYVVKNEDGTFLVINNGATQYQFGITLSYMGSGNAFYTVNSMRSVSSAVSYTYAQTYIMYLMFLGVSIPNQVGQLAFIKEYDESGIITEDYVSGWFAEMNGYADSQGNYLKLEKVFKGEKGETDKYYVDDETATCTITVTMPDGYVYEFMFRLTSVYGLQAYRTVGFIRSETLTTSDGAYTFTVKRIVASDMYTPGSYYNVELTEGENKLEYTEAYIVNGEIVYIVRNCDDNNTVTSSVHYNVALTEKQGSVEEEQTGLKVFESVTIVKKVVTVVYNEDKSQFVEIFDDEIVSIVTQKVSDQGKVSYSTTFARSCEKNADGSYTVVTGGNVTYTVTISDGVATVTRVVTE